MRVVNRGGGGGFLQTKIRGLRVACYDCETAYNDESSTTNTPGMPSGGYRFCGNGISSVLYKSCRLWICDVTRTQPLNTANPCANGRADCKVYTLNNSSERRERSVEKGAGIVRRRLSTEQSLPTKGRLRTNPEALGHSPRCMWPCKPGLNKKRRAVLLSFGSGICQACNSCGGKIVVVEMIVRLIKRTPRV